MKSKTGKPPNKSFNRAKIVEVLAEAAQIGVKAAAHKHGVGERTVHDWKARAAAGRIDVAADVAAVQQELATGWRTEAVDAMRCYARRLAKFVNECTQEEFAQHLPLFTQAFEKLSDAVTSADMLMDDPPEPAKKDPKPNGPPVGAWQSAPTPQATGRSAGIQTGSA